MLALLCLLRISALVDGKSYCLLNELKRILIMLVSVLGYTIVGGVLEFRTALNG